MKRLITYVVLAVTLSLQSFASDRVGHGLKAAGKDSAKVVTVAAKDSAKGMAKVIKFLF